MKSGNGATFSGDDLLQEFARVTRAETLGEIAGQLEKGETPSADQIRLIRDTAQALLEPPEDPDDDEDDPQFEETDLVFVDDDGSERPLVIAKASAGTRGGTASGSNVQAPPASMVGRGQTGPFDGAPQKSGQGRAMVVRRKPRNNVEDDGTGTHVQETQLHGPKNQSDQAALRHTSAENAIGFNETATPGNGTGGSVRKSSPTLARQFLAFLRDRANTQTGETDVTETKKSAAGDSTTTVTNDTAAEAPAGLDAFMKAVTAAISAELTPIKEQLAELTSADKDGSVPSLVKRMTSLEEARGLRKSVDGQENGNGVATPKRGMFDNLLDPVRNTYRATSTELPADDKE